MEQEQQKIDALLERYLGLLDEYTRLRQGLSQVQSSMYQNISRANFSAERGMRYGQDHYDERMQAARRLVIEMDGTEVPTFSMKPVLEDEAVGKEDGEPEETDKVSEEKGETKAEEDGASKASKAKNPLHWFGLFAPMPLRTAQTQSIQAVEDIIPRLVSVNSEMVSVEIDVRRARKQRAKAEAAANTERASSVAVTSTGPQAADVDLS